MVRKPSHNKLDYLLAKTKGDYFGELICATPEMSDIILNGY